MPSKSKGRFLQSFKNMNRIPEVLSCARACNSWLSLTLAYLGVTNLDYPIELNFKSGQVVKVETLHDLITTWIIFFRQEYDVHVRDKVIIDAGANIGVFSIWAARKASNARIIAVEPHPATFSKLTYNIKTNKLEDRVQARPYALSSSNEKRLIDNSDAVPSQSRSFHSNITAGQDLSVNCLTLSSLLEDEKLDRVSLLKMDIEGSEHEVLTATSRYVLQQIDRIAIEYHPNGSKEQLFSYLSSMGFRLYSDRPFAENSGTAHFKRADLD